jgi:hypothetical protein
MANNPKFIDFVLNPNRTALARPAKSLRREANVFSSGEQILVQIALDIWDDSGRARLPDIIYRLDTTRLESFLLAIEILRFSSFHGQPIRP